MKVLPGRKKAVGDGGAPEVRRKKLPTQKKGVRQRFLLFRDRTSDAVSAKGVRARFLNLQRKLHLTRTGQIAIVAAVIPWVIARVVAGNALYIFAYGTAALVITSYLLAPKNLKLKGERLGLRPRAHEGDRMDVEVQLVAERGVSTFILEERVPERLGTTVKVPISKLRRGSTVSHTYGLRCTRRGVYDIGPLVAVTNDPLGLTQRETVLAEKFEMLVHPRIEFVSDRPLTRRYEDPPIRPPFSRPWPSGLEFYGMREYKPGDELRRIVWRASARMGKLMVREAEEGITDHITIILDTDRGSHSQDGDHSESFEMGVRAAASLGVRHLRDGYEIRCETNNGPLTRELRGSTAQLSLLDSFARVEMARVPLSKVISRLITDPRRDAHNILITPKLLAADAAQLRLLLNKGVSILVVALIWDEANTETLSVATALGCQVAGVHPGQDLATALYHDIGAGSR
ncbi:MAG TPA: DUF58 domain-containing protein [Actinomycetota bacterium]|nr:DUF58 domain-containing protein [Actinomycetota bacterium]